MSSLAPVSYLRPRAGLGDVPDRLRAEECTIAYMGASVTAQKDGYRPRLHELIRQGTGRDHRAVAAGLGAMGSISGVFLLDQLVLAHRPDLAFVEYATSDVAGTTPPGRLAAVLEGIVGKLRGGGCEPCFLYLHRGDLELGRSAVVETYERVAAHHGVPSIDVSAWMRAAIERRELDGGALLRDVVHTTELGSALTAEAVWEALEQIPTGPKPALAPVGGDAFTRTRIERPTAALAVRGPSSEGRFRLIFPYLEIDRAGELRFTASGELVGLLVVLGPHSGYIRLEALGEVSEHLLWDIECSYERLGSLIFERPLPAGSEVTIRVSERTVDTSAAKRPPDREQQAERLLKLAGLMVRA